MKKIYFLASTFAFVGLAAAQSYTTNLPMQQAKHSPAMYDGFVPKTPLYDFGQAKAAGDVIFTETFTGSIGTFSATGPNAALWVNETDGPSGNFSATDNSDVIASVTAATGFMILDANLANGTVGLTPWVAQLVSPVVPMTGTPNALIEFQQSYRSCCGNAFELKLELTVNNFATFTSINVNPDGGAVNVFLGTTLKRVDITSFLAANAAGLANFKFRFNWDGSTATTSHYFWQIDDVVVREGYANDLVIFNKNFKVTTVNPAIGLALDYYQFATTQVREMQFEAGARNIGSSAGVNVKLEATPGALPFVVSPTGENIPVSAVDSSLVPAVWNVPATLATYTTSYRIYGNATDGFLSDNSSNGADVRVTDSIFGRDNRIATGIISELSTPGPLIIGNVMEITANDVLTQVKLRIDGKAENLGQAISSEIYKYDGTAWVRFLYTNEITITAANNGTPTNNPEIVFKQFYDGITDEPVPTVQLTAGDVLLVMGKNQEFAGFQVGFRVAQKVEEQTVLGISPDNQSIYYLQSPNAVMIRLILGTVSAPIIVAPVANFVASTTVPTTGQIVSLTNTTPNIANSTYNWTISPASGWSYSGSSSAISVSPNVTFNTVGIYSVTLEANNIAGFDSEVKTNYINVLASLEENQFANLSIYPNPATESLTIDLKDLSGNVTVEVCDVTGKIVSTKVIAGGQLTTIDIKGIATGTYNVRISNGGASTVKRIIKK